MLNRFNHARLSPTRLLVLVGAAACLAWPGLTFFRRPVSKSSSSSPATEAASLVARNGEQTHEPIKMQGEAARLYLEQTNEGQSLMQAVLVEQYGLKWQERVPNGADKRGGYLGMSHEQNLNAWFDEEGVTVRPTLAEKDGDKAWRLDFTLKAYGYGEELKAAPPIVSQNVKGARIEYERSDCRSLISNCRF